MDSTVSDTSVQALPPLPLEPDTSRVKESHPPIEMGDAIATEGDIGEAGAAIVVLLATALSHELVSQSSCSHSALITTLLDNVIWPPNEAQPADLSRKAFTIALLLQRQVDVLAHVNSKTRAQVNSFPTPPLSVLESNVIVTYEPSLANTADLSTGAGSGSLTWITSSVLDCAYTASYFAAVSPTNDTTYEYTPGSMDSREEDKTSDPPDSTPFTVNEDGKNGLDASWTRVSCSKAVIETCRSLRGLSENDTERNPGADVSSVKNKAVLSTVTVTQHSVSTYWVWARASSNSI